MKRRLNFACAISHSPKLLIMDEPTVRHRPAVTESYIGERSSLRRGRRSSAAPVPSIEHEPSKNLQHRDKS
ncbi:hypothetical protein [Paenibacillus apiarius]|uniref:hypothetical protein n=1 Tax=Paenibacillus apiarius TaxID=46240 RepID=UPI003AEF5617